MSESGTPYNLEDWAKEHSRDWFELNHQHVPTIVSCVNGTRESAFVSLMPPCTIKGCRKEASEILRDRANIGATELVFIAHDNLNLGDDETITDPDILNVTKTEVLFILYQTTSVERAWAARVIRTNGGIVALGSWEKLNFQDPYLSHIFQKINIHEWN